MIYINPRSSSVFTLLEKSVLSRPRMMGTPGEKETTEFIQSQITSYGLSPLVEEVKWSTALINGRKVLLALVALQLLLINFLLLEFNQHLLLRPILALISIISFFIVIVLFLKALINGKFSFLGKESIGKNVICKIPVLKTEETNEIILTAHSDSVAVNLASIQRPLLITSVISLLLISLTGIILSILQIIAITMINANLMAYSHIFNWILLILSILLFLMLSLVAISKRVNTSSGAIDNGSGSAILLELANIISKTPLKNTNLTFIWCTAEEWGLYGSKGYVNAHKEELKAKKDQTFLINIDMVGSELGYVEKAGFIRKKPLNDYLNSLIEEIAEKEYIDVQGFSSMFGGNSDHAPFKKLGIEVCCFLASKDVKKIHSSKDNIKAVSEEKLNDAVKLVTQMIYHSDAKKAKVSELIKNL